MPQRKSNCILRNGAAVLSVVFILQSCSNAAQMAENRYRKAKSAEAARDLEKAEQLYISCVSAGLDASDSAYQLAALNSLTALETRLNNHSRAKTYMNQAAALAETIAEKSKSSPPESRSSKQAPVSLEKEQHQALMRLADWEFEDGNYISSRKLYEKAAKLEACLSIPPESNYSAHTRIKLLENRATTESEQLRKALSGKGSSPSPGRTHSQNPSDNRRKTLISMNQAMNKYRDDGLKESADQFLQLLQEIRTKYGAAEPEYRNALRYGVKTFILHSNPEPVASLVETDLNLHKNFSQAELANAIPEAVENATAYTQDLISLALIRRYQGRHREALAACMEAQKLAGRVIPDKSELDFDLNLETARALEHNAKLTEALSYRRRSMALAQTYNKDPVFRAEQLKQLGDDLLASNLPADAAAALKESLEIARAEKNHVNLSFALQSYADALMKLGKYAEAKNVLLEALPYSKRDGNSQLIKNHTALMTACRNSDPRQAIFFGKKSLEELRKSKDPNLQFLIAQNYVSVAEIEVLNKSYAAAIETLEAGIAWQMSQGKELSAATAGMLNLKGLALHESNKLDDEIKCRLRSVEICRRLNPAQPGPLASTLFQTAGAFQQRKKYSDAERLYKETLQIDPAGDDSCKQVQLQSNVLLGIIASAVRKDRSTAEHYKNAALKAYDERLHNNSHVDIPFCLTLAELCSYVHDKKNCQLLLDRAQAAYDKDPVKNREQLAILLARKKTYSPLLK